MRRFPNFLICGLFAAVAALAAAPASADRPVQVADDHLTKEQVVDRVFTNIERRILQRYYEARAGRHSDDDGDRRKGKEGGKGGGMGKDKGPGKEKSKSGGMPPGLAKRGGDLPPGLLKRGGELPPGLAKRLPRDLERDLPRRSQEFRRVVVDNDIVLIDAVTNKVLDILEDVIKG
jgi:hypothetical protein